METKNIAFTFLSALSLLAAGAAHADSAASCSDNVKQTVEAQAKIDFPEETLTAVVPAFRFDGGFVQNLDVPVENSVDTIIATYHAMIDEVCSVELEGKN